MSVPPTITQEQSAGKPIISPAIPELPKDIISRRWLDRLALARDASLYRFVPQMVVRPRHETDIRKLLDYARATHIPVTFRTGGTSLSGQAVTDGIMAEVLRNWNRYIIHENGQAIELEPGVVGDFANQVLKSYQRRIGPDPASLKAARIGGIFNNNASGMCCGTRDNSYHTLKDVRFILAHGHIYDTREKEDYLGLNTMRGDLLKA